MGNSREVSILSENDVLLSSADRDAKHIEHTKEIRDKIGELKDVLDEIKQELQAIKANTAP